MSAIPSTRCSNINHSSMNEECKNCTILKRELGVAQQTINHLGTEIAKKNKEIELLGNTIVNLTLEKVDPTPVQGLDDYIKQRMDNIDKERNVILELNNCAAQSCVEIEENLEQKADELSQIQDTEKHLVKESRKQSEMLLTSQISKGASNIVEFIGGNPPQPMANQLPTGSLSLGDKISITAILGGGLVGAIAAPFFFTGAGLLLPGAYIIAGTTMYCGSKLKGPGESKPK